MNIENRSEKNWTRIDSLLDAALDVPPEERRAFLERECNGDDQFYREMCEIISACEIDSGFLEASATDFAADFVESDDRESATSFEIGPYRLLRELARGGMGRVFLAERADGQFEQKVAIKLIKRGMDSEEILRRFRSERQILARLNHPNIAKLLDGGVTPDGQPWFAMEYVDGLAITRHAAQRGLSVNEKLDLFEHVCDAVRYAHQNLVVHRDLKPSNILVTADGTVKLLDFGIAKLLSDSADDQAHTGTGLIAMTPEYAAPEQVRLEAITTATDVYALGGVLYELLTGRRVHHFSKLTPLEVERIVCEIDPPPPRVTSDLDTIVMKALQKLPSRRYASADALLDDLRRYRAGLPVRARPDTARYRTAKFIRRHRFGVTAASAVAVSIIAGLSVALWETRVANGEARRAEEVKKFLIGLFASSDPQNANGRAVTARELLDRGTIRVDSALRTQPEVQSEIFAVVGLIYQSLGDYAKADSLLRRSVSMSRSIYGPQSSTVAVRKTEWAEILQLEGHYQAADSLLTATAAIIEKDKGPKAPELARALEALANLKKLESDHAAAASLYERAVQVRAASADPDSLELSMALRALGNVYWEQFRIDAAEKAARRAFSIQQRHLPPDHVEITRTMRVLSGVERDRGNLTEAAKLGRLVLANTQRLFPAGHPDVGTALDELAIIEELAGNYAQAESLSIQAIAVRSKFLGPDRVETLNSRNSLSLVHWRMHDLPRAETESRKVVEGYIKSVGQESRSTFWGMSNLGAILRDNGKYAESKSLLTKAVAGRRKILGNRHPSLASTLRHLGVLDQMTGNLEDAERNLREAVEIDRATVAPRSPLLAEALTDLAAVMTARNKAADAEPLLHDAISTWTGQFASSDLRLAETRRVLGIALASMGRFAEAETVLSSASTAIAGHPYGGHKRELIAEARSRIAEWRARAIDHLEPRALLASR